MWIYSSIQRLILTLLVGLPFLPSFSSRTRDEASLCFSVGLNSKKLFLFVSSSSFTCFLFSFWLLFIELLLLRLLLLLFQPICYSQYDYSLSDVPLFYFSFYIECKAALQLRKKRKRNGFYFFLVAAKQIYIYIYQSIEREIYRVSYYCFPRWKFEFSSFFCIALHFFSKAKESPEVGALQSWSLHIGGKAAFCIIFFSCSRFHFPPAILLLPFFHRWF